MDPYAASGSPEEEAAAGAPPRAWEETEPKLWRALRRATLRLLARSRASWPIWVALVALGCAGSLAWRIRHPPPYTTTLVFRITEGTVPVAPESLSSRALRAYIFDLAFSRHNLTPLAERLSTPRQGRAPDIGETITDILDATTITIGESDFIEDRAPGDPPRSVRIELTFRDATPDGSWTMAHALADLMVASERDRRVRVVERHAAESNAAAKQAGRAGEAEVHRAEPSAGAVAERENELRDSAQTWLARRSLDENQALRFELTDPGRHPADQFRSLASLVGALAVFFPFLLFAAALLAGAVDPRVLDADDLTAMGIVVLGRGRSAARV